MYVYNSLLLFASLTRLASAIISWEFSVGQKATTVHKLSFPVDLSELPVHEQYFTLAYQIIMNGVNAQQTAFPAQIAVMPLSDESGKSYIETWLTSFTETVLPQDDCFVDIPGPKPHLMCKRKIEIDYSKPFELLVSSENDIIYTASIKVNGQDHVIGKVQFDETPMAGLSSEGQGFLDGHYSGKCPTTHSFIGTAYPVSLDDGQSQLSFTNFQTSFSCWNDQDLMHWDALPNGAYRFEYTQAPK